MARMSRTRRGATAVLAALALFATSVVVPSSLGAPKPPAPGNGGGKSGQCTGGQTDRPASCTSTGGPGDQG
jgi:hypothetical protein